MLRSKYKWKILNRTNSNQQSAIFHILLENRNITKEDEAEFLLGEMVFHSPFLFKDMKKAVGRIKQAIDNQERVMIYGDYDVDGVTATSILYKTLKQLGLETVDYYIPNRFTEGYGPNMVVFKEFVAHDYQLVITVDNGITGVAECQYLMDQGVDVIITDHHEAKDTIPQAYAIIHPNLEGETYPFSDLAGCGVSFKLAEALLGYVPKELSDLAAIGTFADIVSAVGENRSILKLGLKQLENTTHLGLRYLNQIAKVTEVNEFTLGFVYGPRLNAPGRMESAMESVRLLTSTDEEEVYQLAQLIEDLNNQRKQTIDEVMEEAEAQIERENLEPYNVLVLANENWHEGILGIVAARLVDNHGKPAIILTENDGVYKGSARTFADFPLFENLNKCEHLLLKFGGHKMAAGLTIEKENIQAFREQLHNLAGNGLCNELIIDCPLDGTFVNAKFMAELEQLRPYGPSNKEPRFLFEDYTINNLKKIGAKGKHLKFTIEKEAQKVDAIAFNLGYLYYELIDGDVVDVVGSILVNEFNNKISYQIKVDDLACRQLQIYDYRNRYFDKSQLNPNVVQLIYFNHNQGFDDAIHFSNITEYKAQMFLIDMPTNINELKAILEHKALSKLYVLFKEEDMFSMEHLMTREKMIKIYSIYRKFENFHLDDTRVLNELKKFGFNKKIHLMSIKVFFELNFVIIEGKEVKVIMKPEKRDLQESKTFNEMIATVKMREILALSSTNELKEFLFNL